MNRIYGICCERRARVRSDCRQCSHLRTVETKANCDDGLGCGNFDNTVIAVNSGEERIFINKFCQMLKRAKRKRPRTQ